MENVPEWVPSSVVSQFQNLDQGKEKPGGFRTEDIDALRRCILSTQMEMAWKSIQRRSDRSDPEEIANIIAITNSSIRRVQRVQTPSQIVGHRKLAQKARKLSSIFSAAMDDPKIELRVGLGAQKYLEGIAARLEKTANMSAEIRRNLKVYSGKLSSKSGLQTFVIRSLYFEMWRLYKQPLHIVVASIATEILQNRVDPETARSVHRRPEF